MTDVESPDPEREPLLASGGHQSSVSVVFDEKFAGSYTFDLSTGKIVCGNAVENESLKKQGIDDTMSYSTERLASWKAFGITYTAIWVSKDLWIMMLHLCCVAVLVSLCTLLLVPNPEAQKVSKFTDVSKFLNVVVGLLLGFFLSSSMNRWYGCVNGFLELLDAIRNLQMQFTALGVPEHEAFLCLRWAFASAWLLYGQLLVEGKQVANHSSDHELMWKLMGEKKAPCDTTGQAKLLTESEIDFLSTTRDPPGIVFMWIAALIGRLAQDGWIPPMASPTYGRIMNLCQNGHAGIRQVRASISVQAPLNYSHMLATLVHLNNLLNAVTLGIVAGLSFGTVLSAHNVHIYPSARSANTMMRESEQDLQNLMVTVFYCTLGPVLYQALLTISMHLAQPFYAEDSRMPLHRLLHQLEVDMCNGKDAAKHLPFPRPAFKQPPSS